LDIDKLNQCEDEDDFSDLMLEDIMGGYKYPDSNPNHKQIAVVDHLSTFDIVLLKQFFKKVQEDLNVRFHIGDATSLTIEGKRFYRYFLYSDEHELVSFKYPDGLYRLQEPVFERLDGIAIDLKNLSVRFKNDGETLCYKSVDELKHAVKKILNEYWPDLENPDVRIVDSISEYPDTKWMVESISNHLMATEPRERAILLANKIAEFIPELELEFSGRDYIPLMASLQIAEAMNKLDIPLQHKTISRLTLRFGFFDEFAQQRPR